MTIYKWLMLQSHTILLVQPTKRPEGRTYADYESVNECMEGRIIFIQCYTLELFALRLMLVCEKQVTVYGTFVLK